MKAFLLRNRGVYGENKANQELYFLMHTVYLGEVDYKRKICDQWKKDLDVDLDSDSLHFLKRNYFHFIDSDAIVNLKNGIVLSRNFDTRDLERILLRLSFDCWLIQREEEKKEINIDQYYMTLRAFYKNSLLNSWRFFRKYEIPFIEDFKTIAIKLLPFKDEIYSIYKKVYQKNKTRILSMIEKSQAAGNHKEKTTTLQKNHEDNAKRNVNRSHQQEKQQIAHNNDNSKAKEKNVDSQNQIISDYELLLHQQKVKISRLEQDIVEFQRQRDEAREQLAAQHDRGIHELFSAMNSDRYSKPIEYFYHLMLSDSTDDNLKAYLENFFFALEEMDIEPILEDRELGQVKEENLTKKYNLDFNKTEYQKDKIAVKYVGWKYKDNILEKPTLTLKEE